MARDKDEVFPVDLPSGHTFGGRPLLWTTVAIGVASLFLLLTNAESLNAWANELSPSPGQAKLAAATAQWEEMTESVGLGAARDAMHALWKKAQAAKF